MIRFILDEPERVGSWVISKAGGQWMPGRGSTIGLERDGVLCAGVLVEDWNGASCVMHVAGDKGWKCDEFFRYVFGYVFRELDCRCIFGIVASDNARCLALGKQLGFEEVIHLEAAHPRGDLVILRMWKEQCKWLEMADAA